MNNIQRRLTISTSSQKLFWALTSQVGLAALWIPATWAEETKLIFGFGFDYHKAIAIIASSQDRSVAGLCGNATPEWIGTTSRFTIELYEKGSLLVFEHNNGQDYTAVFSQRSYDWAMFLRSLRLLCETGKGLPFPHQHQ
ncbi:MAG: hypothetical protein RIE86_21445 [Imperialibacter sp.]|uniref:hypothetical protein n=1 Tax=Imperialibacter sp. TaxID=2038411 RepID=UPI0032ED89C1